MTQEFIESSVFFGAAVSLTAYGIGMYLNRKFHFALFNPLLISIILTIAVLLLMNVSYDSYYRGAQYLSYLLTPATVCLAVPLYEKLETLKKNWKAILAGILSGILSSFGCVGHVAVVPPEPRRIRHIPARNPSRRPSESAWRKNWAGYISIAAAAIIITGIVGNISAEILLRIFRVTEPVAKGIAIGSSSHVIGTTKAVEMGGTEGAVSSLSIVVSGLITAVAASFFAQII